MDSADKGFLGKITAAKTEETHLLIPVGIPNPLLHNHLKSHGFARTPP